MSFAEGFKERIFKINEQTFESCVLDIFRYQYQSNTLYQTYCKSIEKNPTNVTSISQIPFLPIEFFKQHVIKSGDWTEEKVFKSSGTTKTGRSNHFIKDLKFYNRLSQMIFENKYGPLDSFEIAALLPSYQEAGDSSLIAMVDYFIANSRADSNYYLDNSSDLPSKLSENEHKKLLIGVSYALLDLAENHPNSLKNCIIMETGGMKGRRQELTRNELHKILQNSFQTKEIHSEYGMTELLSQAYGKNGQFSFPKWAKVLVRDINDPFSYVTDGKTGGINIIDLANVDTCAFVETKDLGIAKNGTFEVLGRFDNSDVRGCNLLV